MLDLSPHAYYAFDNILAESERVAVEVRQLSDPTINDVDLQAMLNGRPATHAAAPTNAPTDGVLTTTKLEVPYWLLIGMSSYLDAEEVNADVQVLLTSYPKHLRPGLLEPLKSAPTSVPLGQCSQSYWRVVQLLASSIELSSEERALMQRVFKERVRGVWDRVLTNVWANTSTASAMADVHSHHDALERQLLAIGQREVSMVAQWMNRHRKEGRMLGNVVLRQQ